MGQYHYTVNLTKREFLNPHKLGDGLKLREQIDTIGGVPTALVILLACSNGRGGGDLPDFQEYRIIKTTAKGDEWGWVVTDQRMHELAKQFIGRWAGDRIAVVGDYATDDDLQPDDKAGKIYEWCDTGVFRDITDDILPLIGAISGVCITGSGWRDKCKVGQSEPLVRMVPDLVITVKGDSNER